MNVDFKWIEYKNILSVGAKSIRIDLEGYKKTLITGHNGAGKSTSIEALTFLWFGKAFRDIKKGLLVNTLNKKGLLVEGEIQVGNKLIYAKRGIKPDVFEISVNGTPVDKMASVTEFQQYLETELLGFSYDSFKQIIVLGTAGYTPFMELPAAQRRSLVEDLLNVSILGTMDKDNKAALKRCNTQAEILSNQMDSLSRERDTAASSIASQKAQIDGLINKSTAELIELVGTVKTLKADRDVKAVEIEGLKYPKFDQYQERIDEVNMSNESDDILQGIAHIEELIANDPNVVAQEIAKLGPEPVFDEAAFNAIIVPTDADLTAAIYELTKTVPDEYISQEIPAPELLSVDYDSMLGQANDTRSRTKMRIEQIQERRRLLANGVCPTCNHEIDASCNHEIDDELSDLSQRMDDNLLVISDTERKRDDQKAENERRMQAHRDAVADNATKLNEYQRATAAYVEKCKTMERDHRDLVAAREREREDLVRAVDTLKMVWSSNKFGIENVHQSMILSWNSNLNSYRGRLQFIERDKSDKITAIKAEYDAAKAAVDHQRSLMEVNLESQERRIELETTRARSIKTQIDEWKATAFDESAVTEIEEQIKIVQVARGETLAEKHARSIIGNMLKDNGIKAHIVRKYIPVFNKKINEYLTTLGADYCFALDDSFSETIKSRGREEFCYASFSEGEKARINLSLLFTWRDVSSMVSGVHVNMLFLDEVFDGSCDEAGLKGINSILAKMKSNAYVISHRPDALDDSFDRHIVMHKQGRFTTMVE